MTTKKIINRSIQKLEDTMAKGKSVSKTTTKPRPKTEPIKDKPTPLQRDRTEDDIISSGSGIPGDDPGEDEDLEAELED